MAAAADVGVSESTVYVHRRKDSLFAAEFQEALEQSYVRLEAEALRQRLEAQRRLRAAIENSSPSLLGERVERLGSPGDCRKARNRLRGSRGRNGDGGAPPSGLLPATSPRQAGGGFETDIAGEFERVMKLLARWDRRGSGPGPRQVRHGHRQRMSFDEAMALLEKKLQALGYSVDSAEDEEEGRSAQ